jgi:3-phenylpropionate/trans-cinnamate dioxygenase ferredoxin subunit
VSDFVRAADLSDVPKGGVLGIEIGDLDIALVRDGDDVYAMHDFCSHADIPLSDGEVEGCEIECWLHGSRFDVRTGKALNPPAVQPVPIYPCHVEGDGVFVDVTDHSTTQES